MLIDKHTLATSTSNAFNSTYMYWLPTGVSNLHLAGLAWTAGMRSVCVSEAASQAPA